MRERLSDFVGKVKAREAAVGSLAAMAIKASGAVLTLLVFTLAGRAMNADEFGRLAIWFNMVSFLAVAAVFAQDTLIVRSFGEYAGTGNYREAWGAYRFGWALTIMSALVAVVGMGVLSKLAFACSPRDALLGAAFFLVTQTMLHYSSHSSRVIVGFFVSEVTREIVWRIVLLAVVVWAVLHRGLTRSDFFIAAGVGQALAVIVALYHVHRFYLEHPVDSCSYRNWRDWLRRTLPMWQSAILEAVSMYFDVMLIGLVASPAAAGDYFAAARIANVFMMVLTGLNTYTVSHSATLYFSGQVEKLQEIVRTLVLVSTAMLAPLLVLIYVFGDKLLTIFGARFASDYPTLVILSTACFIMSMCGSASVILLTTGRERLYSRIIGAATVVRVSLTGLLAWRFGAPGAAVGWALVNAPMFMLLSAICQRDIGVDPSVASAIGMLRARMRGLAG